MQADNQQTDAELAKLLARAAKPPLPRADLAQQIAAQARRTPQHQAPHSGARFAAAITLAASLLMGIWLGANDTTASLLPQIGTSTADAGYSIDQLTDGGEIL